MFVSNQIFDVTCDKRSLPMMLDTIVRLYGAKELFTRDNGRINPAFQKPCGGLYLLGTGSMEPYKTGPNKGWAHDPHPDWTDFQFDWDEHLVAGVLDQWLGKNPPDRHDMPDTDGSVEPGFRLRSVYSLQQSEEFPRKHPLWDRDLFPVIIAVTPCWLRYDK